MRRRGGFAVAAVLLVGLAAGWCARSGPAPVEVAPIERAVGERVQQAAPRPRARSGWRDVRCVVAGSTEGDEIVAMAVETKEATQTALVEDGGFVLVLPSRALTLLFDVPGLETVHAAVDAGGACTVTNQPNREIALTVSVRLPSGKVPSDNWIRGCGHGWWHWAASDPVLRVTASEPCELEAWGAVGMTQVSEPVRIDPAGGDRPVDLVFDWEDPAGLNLQVAEQDDAFTVTEVKSEAAEHLAVGDRIVAIEGVPTADLTLADFIRLDAGPPDTFVELVVVDDEGTRREVRVPREQ